MPTTPPDPIDRHAPRVFRENPARDPQGRSARPARVAVVAAAWLGVLLATGCAVEVQNLKPAQERAAERDRPAGSVQLGWRVYVEKCAGCHGMSATGGGQAPDLLVRMRDLGPRRFAELVLLRYDLEAMTRRTPDASAPRDAQIDDILQRRDRPLAMPAWQGEPRVTAHILDLFAYLSARAEGRQDAGRPTR